MASGPSSDLSVEQVVDAIRNAGAQIDDPADLVSKDTEVGGTDATTRIYMFVIGIGAAILIVLLVLIMTFN